MKINLNELNQNEKKNNQNEKWFQEWSVQSRKHSLKFRRKHNEFVCFFFQIAKLKHTFVTTIRVQPVF